jgi:hypothetical protein
MVVCRGAEEVVRLVLRRHHIHLSASPVLTTVAGPPALAVRLLAEDVSPQQHGYLVHRVLAEDITDNPAAVAAQIREVVRSRLRSGRHHGSSA